MNQVLYVSHSKRGAFYYNDASARYRCVFPAEEHIASGEQAHAIHFSQINKVTLSNYKKIIFHRPQFSLKLWLIVKLAKKKNIELWVDFDDLLFCPELSDSSAAVQSGKMPVSLAKKHAKRYLKALKLFSNYQVSTDELADKLANQLALENIGIKKINSEKPNIKISYNKVPERWVRQAEIIPAEERLEKKIIRYLPGTSHHKHDFAHVEAFLAELLHKNPSYHLNIIGDLEFDYESFPKGQISTTPFQPYEQLPSLINDSWIIIAPLVDNVFNRCKSGLKFWEGGVFGIPVISSPLRDVERFENKGLCISDDLEEWKQYVLLLENSSKYEEASKQAKNASAKSVFLQSDESKGHRTIYLALTTKFGPRWPAFALNPTNNTDKNIRTFVCNTQNSELEKKAIKSIQNDQPPTTNKTLRKAKKLMHSPKKFINDSKLCQSFFQ